MKIATVIQARTGSSRFPGKILNPLCGKPLLIRMIERVKASEESGNIIVATTTLPEDDIICELCLNENINFFRGSATDLLDRHYQAVIGSGADAVVKIPSDCPLIDPEIITKILKYYIKFSDKFDFVSNLHPASYPDGNDVEVMSFQCLKTAWSNAGKAFEREHTTPYIWENPHLFRIGNVSWDSGLDYSMSHRWTIDYEEDYNFINSVYEELFTGNNLFGIYDILNLLSEKNRLQEINQKYAGVNWYRNHLDQLKTITSAQTKIIK